LSVDAISSASAEDDNSPFSRMSEYIKRIVMLQSMNRPAAADNTSKKRSFLVGEGDAFQPRKKARFGDPLQATTLAGTDSVIPDAREAVDEANTASTDMEVRDEATTASVVSGPKGN
jgi:hypothetical protein